MTPLPERDLTFLMNKDNYSSFPPKGGIFFALNVVLYLPFV